MDITNILRHWVRAGAIDEHALHGRMASTSILTEDKNIIPRAVDSGAEGNRIEGAFLAKYFMANRYFTGICKGNCTGLALPVECAVRKGLVLGHKAGHNQIRMPRALVKGISFYLTTLKTMH